MGTTVNRFDLWLFRRDWVWHLLPSSARERWVDRIVRHILSPPASAPGLPF